MKASEFVELKLAALTSHSSADREPARLDAVIAYLDETTHSPPALVERLILRLIRDDMVPFNRAKLMDQLNDKYNSKGEPR